MHEDSEYSPFPWKTLYLQYRYGFQQHFALNFNHYQFYSNILLQKKNNLPPITRAVRRSLKYTRKNPVSRVQKNLRNINWYSCYELFKTGKFHTFPVPLMIHVSCPELSRSCFATRYKIFSNITHQPALRYFRMLLINPVLFFFRVCLRKFIGTRELFVPRPYFRLHSTEKRSAKLLWVPLQIIFCLECSKPQSKYKIWV